jgi:hypothetical protein
VTPSTQTRRRAPLRAKRARRLVTFRRTPFVISYWLGDQLVFENYLTRRRITASPLTAAVLHFFHRWRSIGELAASYRGYTQQSLSSAVHSLAEHSFLQRRGHPVPGATELEAWRQWNPAAGFFHFSTKDLPFERDAKKEYRAFLRLAR